MEDDTDSRFKPEVRGSLGRGRSILMDITKIVLREIRCGLHLSG
jgi:hypothetical protein